MHVLESIFMSANSQLSALRARIAQIESGEKRPPAALPFGVEAMDRKVPGGGLALGALHEVAGGGKGAIHGSAALLFTAGIAARTTGQILWCVKRCDVFAPSLAQVGLHPDRLIYAEVGDEKAVMACMEEGLRHGGLSAVVGELAHLPMIASRRLQLCAEETGTIALAIRRWRSIANLADFGQPTASVTRWRVTALPSPALPVPGIGRARWRIELIRARAGHCADFEMEACDEQGRLALPADLVDGSADKKSGRIGAAA